MYGKDYMEAIDRKKRREYLHTFFRSLSPDDVDDLREYLRSLEINTLEQAQLRNTYGALPGQYRYAKYPA